MNHKISEVMEMAIANFLRPVLILICGMLLFNLPTLIYKIRMFAQGLMYLTFCNDKSWTKPQDPGSIFGPLLSSGTKVERKRVYFVRHGESTWNDTFNKGSHRSAVAFAVGFVPGLIKALLYELYLVLSGKLDSWFYDSPISYLGLGQVDELTEFLKETPVDEAEGQHLAVLRADPGAPPSKIVCSSLRRAVSTIAAGFRDRLARRREEKILIIPSLQEISRNPDTLSITPAYTLIQASWVDKSSKSCDFQDIYSNQIDMSLHAGNKPLNTNGLKRMNEFCEFLYSPSVQEDHIIAGGHSIWFRSFFQTYLPYRAIHQSKTRKIKNGGVVTFELLKVNTESGSRFMIDPKTITVVYGGFA